MINIQRKVRGESTSVTPIRTSTEKTKALLHKHKESRFPLIHEFPKIYSRLSIFWYSRTFSHRITNTSTTMVTSYKRKPSNDVPKTYRSSPIRRHRNLKRKNFYFLFKNKTNSKRLNMHHITLKSYKLCSY